jgi:hypothetical protein
VFSVKSRLCSAEYLILRSSLVALLLFPLSAPTTAEDHPRPPGPPTLLSVPSQPTLSTSSSVNGKKGKAVSAVTGLEWPRGFQEVKVPRFHDNGTGWW